MKSATLDISKWPRLAARIRIPVVVVAFVVLVVGFALSVPSWWALLSIVVWIGAMALYLRLGTPRARPIELGSPVRGPWRALNSPTSRVPSHLVHAWAQTYAIDLVYTPSSESRPQGWWPPLRRPEQFPGFGQPVFAPIDGEVVRVRSFLRDHLSRDSPFGLAYMMIESVRELLGPLGILGNHVVIRRGDGVCVLLAHLRHDSVRVKRGETVTRGDLIAQCGNSGNSSEPHLHLQAMDLASPWFAAGLPIRFNGLEPPANGELLDGKNRPHP